MKLGATILVVAAVYVLLFFGHALYLRKTVYGDGIFYYAWLRSAVVDRDIRFGNEYKTAGVSQPKTPTGMTGNKYSIGPALFWAPAYTMAYRIMGGSGWEFPYQLIVGLVSVGGAITGLVLLSRILAGADQPITILAIAGSTNLLFYGALDPVNSHALSFVAATVFLTLVTSTRKHWLAIGVSLAVLTSVRPQDIVYALALLPYVRKIPWRSFLGGFAAGMLPQGLAWVALNGTLINPYFLGGESFNLFRPHILGVLFGSSSGLILWTPVVAVGIYGLILERRTLWPYLAVFMAQVYLVASWSTWWQGASVSGRMFVSTLPVMALGIQAVIRKLPGRPLLRPVLPILVLALTLINALAITYYLLTF